VGLTRRLYERFYTLIHEVAKFGIVGGIAFLVTEVGTNVLHFNLHAGPITANVIATIVATFVSYLGNRFWTFRHRSGMSNVAGEYGLFFLLNGIGLVIQLSCIGFTYYVLGMNDKLSYNVALFIGIVLGTLFRFWSYRRWVWRAHPGQPDVPSDGPIPVVPAPDLADPDLVGYPEGRPAVPPGTGPGHGAGRGRHAAPGGMAQPQSRGAARDVSMPGAPRTGR
jgi:putative flippase GtrA